MATTVSISVPETSVLEGHPVVFTALFSNSGGTDVAVNSSNVALPLGTPANVSANLVFSDGSRVVPAGGSKYATFGVTFYPRESPEDSDTPQWGFSVALASVISDGSYVESNVIDMQVTPVTIDVPDLPVAGAGQLRFDSLNNALLLPVLL